MTQPTNDQKINGALLRLRIIWMAIVTGQVAFVAIVVAMIRGGMQPYVTGELAQSLFYASMGVLVLGLVGGYIARMQTYKRCWEADRVTPEGFFMGNLLLYAIMEGVSIVGVVVVFLTAQLSPQIVPAAAALLVMVINFPGGGPMRDATFEKLM